MKSPFSMKCQIASTLSFIKRASESRDRINFKYPMGIHTVQDMYKRMVDELQEHSSSEWSPCIEAYEYSFPSDGRHVSKEDVRTKIGDIFIKYNKGATK